MIERAIENWLINTNERNYQIPFCQMLISQGYEILDISTHGRLEFGKDIIAKDKKGKIYCYQLKTGDIDIPKWDKIYREIMDLVKTPCEHPNVNKKFPHISYLVSNGKISIDVLQRVTKENEYGNHPSKLLTLDKNQLLPLFVKAQGKFLPKSFEDFQEFLSFFQLKGNEFFPKKEFFIFIKEKILQSAKSKSDKLNSIFALVILTSYILKNFQNKKNYFAEFEVWTILYSTIVGFINKENLSDKRVNDTLILIKSILLDSLDNLTSEFIERGNLIEGSTFGDGGAVYKARITIMLGLICCNKLYYNSKFDPKLHKKILENLKFLWLWGDSAFPYLFFIIKYLEKNKFFDNSNIFLKTILESVIKCNSFRSKFKALPNPYYNINEILESPFSNNPLDFNQFKASSYILNPLIEMFARRKSKKVLKENWRKISHIEINKFIPKEGYENFYFWNREGINYSNFPKQTQSWKELQAVSKNKSYPDYLLKNKSLLPLFFIVYPHRISEELIACLDN